MFCKNCGKEFPEGAKFCDACGSRLEEAVVAEEPVAAEEPVVAEEPVAPVIPEPVPPKKKGGLVKILIAAAAVVAVLGVSVFAAFPYVKNFVTKTFLPAEKYYQSVEKGNIGKVTDDIASVFDEIKAQSKVMEENYDSLSKGKAPKADETFDGKKLSGSLSLTLGEPIMDLLEEYAELDLGFLKKSSLAIDLSTKDELSELAMALALSDDKIVSAEVISSTDGIIYLSLPELSEEAIKIDLASLLGYDDFSEIYASDEMEETYDMLFKLIDALPDGKTASKIIERYSNVILSELDDADKSKETVSVGDVEVNATAIEVTIDEKTLENIVIAVIKEFEDDEELWDTLDALMVASGEAEKGEFKEYLEDGDIFDDVDEMIEGSFEGFGEITLVTYLNSKGEVLGREIEYLDNTLTLLSLEKGKSAAFEVSLDGDVSFKLVGEGTLKKGIFDGEVTLKVMGQSILTATVEGFDTENLGNGKITLKPSKMISAMLSEYEADDVSSLLGLGMNSLDIDLSDISLVIDMACEEEKSSLALDLFAGTTSVIRIETEGSISDAKSIKLPKDAVEIEDEYDLEEWAENINFEGFIENLPEELQDMLGDISFAGVADEPYYEESWETEEPVYPDNALFLATSSDFEPFVYSDEYGNLTGIDIEIASAIAIELGMVLYVEDMDFDSLIGSVASGDNAIAMSAITATEERLEAVDFTEYYICNTQVVLAKEDSPVQYLSDLYENTYRIGVKEGTTAYYYATDDFGIDNVYYYESYEALLSGLTDGFVDLIILDYPYATRYDEEVEGVKRLAEDYAFEPYCIAVSKDNPELTEKINEAIITLRYNGTLSEIYNRYISDTPVVSYVSVPAYNDYYDDAYEDVYYDYEYDYDYDYDFSGSIFDYEFSEPSTMFDTDFGMDGYGYSYTEEPVMDDYYYNDYYYSDRHTEDYFSDYGY